MTIPRFIQIHTLHAYPAALLNRDEAGMAKRMPIGGAMRTRISSQCLKRRWREAQDEFGLRNIPGAAAGLEGALFGRMITSDPEANIEAALYVAHAFTVHAEEREIDYFSVVDDLQQGKADAGAAPIGATELTAGIFYGYVVVDVPGLVSNLEGCLPEEWQGADRGLAGQVMKHLVHLIATVSPGAKLGSTAPYSCADLMLVEAGSRQPRSLANAYRTPAQPEMPAAITALAEWLEQYDRAYGGKEVRRVMSLADCELPGAARLDLDALAMWTADVVQVAEAV